MKSNSSIVLLLVGFVLLGVGVFKPNLSNIINKPQPIINNIELLAPTDPLIKEKADAVVGLVKSMDTNDSTRLRDLYLDMATLIKLDGEDMVIKNTEEIRQANSISGLMLKLDIKNKYKNLADANKDVIVAAIGDDNILLNEELRAKAVEGFNALAWAFNGGK